MRPPSLPSRLQGAGLVMLYVLVGAWWVEAVPPYEAPDEPWHVAYAESLNDGRWPDESDTYEAHQPAGYYLGVAAILRVLDAEALPRSPANVFFPSAEAAHFHPPDEPAGLLTVLRTLTGFLAASAVALAWAAGRRLLPRRAAVGNVAGLIVALLPQYQHIGHSVSNDAAAVAVGGAFIYLGVRSAAGIDRSVLVGLPVVAALAVGAKLTAWSAAAAPLVGLIGSAGQSGREARRAALALTTSIAAVALVVSTARLTVPQSASAALADALRRGSLVDRDVLAVDTLWGLGRSTLMSSWGRFGWLTVDLPSWLYMLAGIVVLAGFAGALATLGHLPRAGRMGTVAAGAACAAAAAAWFRNLLADPQPQGRLMFGSLVAAALILAVGYAGRGDRVRTVLKSLPLVTVLVVSNAAALLWALPRAFEPWRTAPPTVLALTARPNLVVVARLSGEAAQATQTFAVPGDVSRIAVAVHRAYGEGTALMRVVGPDDTELGSTLVRLDDLPLDSWIEVTIAAKAPVSAAGGERRPSTVVAPRASGGTYRAEISMLRGSGSIELWGAPEDDYPAGQLTVDGRGGTDLAMVILGP